MAIRICGLQVSLSYRLQVGLGTPSDFFCSWGDFVADRAGCIATDGQAPTAGSYGGVDADKLFWSMAKSDAGQLSLQTSSYDLRLFASSGEEVIATQLPFKIVGDGLQVRQVSLAESGFVGRLFMPALAVAYFGLPGLPQSLAQVLLEYFEFGAGIPMGQRLRHGPTAARSFLSRGLLATWNHMWEQME